MLLSGLLLLVGILLLFSYFNYIALLLLLLLFAYKSLLSIIADTAIKTITINIVAIVV